MAATPIRPGAGLDWNATSADYAHFRPGYPLSSTRESWRGRIRVSKWSDPETFEIPHRISLHVLDLGD